MGAQRKIVWITRAQPGAAATAERVAALGHEARVVPLLSVRDLPEARVDLDGVTALAFTSANGVRAFAERTPIRDLRVFAVGAATAQAAKMAGFRTVLSGEGDVDVLAERIAERRLELKGVVLHPGAAEPAGDLTGALGRLGVEARGLALYETTFAEIGPEQAANLAACDVVLLHSPKAARALMKILKLAPALQQRAPHIRALGLSKAVLRPLARSRLGARAHPPFPLEAALLNLIDRTS